GEDALLIRLERGRHEAFAVRDRLSPLIVRWHEMQIRPRDLDVVAEHPVEADFQRLNAGALALVRLNARDGVAAAVAEPTKLVQLGVDTGSNGGLLANARRRVSNENALNVSSDIRTRIPLVDEGFDQRAAPIARLSDGGERVEDVRQSRHGRAEGTELSRRAASKRRLGRQSFEIAYAVERVSQRFASQRCSDERI